MALKLFEDSDHDEDNAEDRSNIAINEEYARRFEHNKRREDMHRLAELQKKGLVSDGEDESSEEDDEDAEDLVGSSKTDLQFFDTLVKVKKMDPVIQQKDAKLYSSSEEEDDDDGDENKGGGGGKKKPAAKKEKPLYIKDVTARHLLEDGPEFEEAASRRESQSKVYSKEQEENRKAFLEAIGGAEGEDHDDSGDEFFKVKKSENQENEDPEDVVIRKKMDEYWGDDGNLDENELFLKKFLSKKMWASKGKGGEEVVDGDLLEEDEGELEKQEKYEAEYNFRFEEGAGDRVLGHARFTEGSVRKKNNARKVQRKSKEERMVQAEFERKEELKRLKNLKKKEIREKLEKIRAIAGIREEGACNLNEDDLEEEFDPDEYDKKMKEMFGTDYYEDEDADSEFGSDDEDGLQKPDFDKEDELLGLPKDWDVISSGDGFRTEIKRCRKDMVNEEGEEDIEEEDAQYESKRKKKRKISLREKVELDKELEDYYKLDYEDTIGDLKTRFKYKSVPSNRYGLSAAEVLMTDDKDLNQYVSIKKLAPYRQDEWKVPKTKKYQMKMKVWMDDPGEQPNDAKNNRKNQSKSSGFTESANKSQQVSNGEAHGEDQPSRRSRRRRRQAELKLPQSRLMAYGKIAPQAKKKKKH